MILKKNEKKTPALRDIGDYAGIKIVVFIKKNLILVNSFMKTKLKKDKHKLICIWKKTKN